MITESHSVDETRTLGAALATACRAGDLIILEGPLGAGKTAFVQGIGVGLETVEPVTSPTFVIARTHRSSGSRPPLVHVDAYRLSGLDDVDALDLDASMEESVTVVEWGVDRVEQLAQSHLRIKIELLESDENARRFTFSAEGESWASRLAALTNVSGNNA